MDRAVLSLCVLGAGLATANILIMQRQTCPSAGAEVVAAHKEAPSAVIDAAQSKPAQAAKAGATTPAQTPTADRAQGKPEQAPKATKPAAPPIDLDRTGSVNQTEKPNGEESAPLSQTELGEARDRQANVEGEEQWAEVSLAARVHSAPSVSSPTVRHYRVGTRLKVIGHESGWIAVIDPTTSKKGWIFEKYLTLKGGSDQKQAGAPEQSQKPALRGSEMPNDARLVAPAKPGYKRYYEPRKYAWRRYYRYLEAPVGFAIRVYPGW
jgi:hypothetical protein